MPSSLRLALPALAILRSSAFVLPSTRPDVDGPLPGLREAHAADRPSRGHERDDRGSAEASSSFSLVVGLAVGFFVAVTPALASDLENGQGIFLANCAACHAGGNNAVQPDKKLKKEALETYGMFDVERIKYQVTNGKNAMPAFGERLGPEDIEDVANYVIDQANKGWL
mmetsp:Transcript_11549/g.21871  ORF Transcript_11549/g.21871 Transcript_11549/m.21871 type:complete len:169 (+) Transcript_11549:42-548(+)